MLIQQDKFYNSKTETAFGKYQNQRQQHWNSVASKKKKGLGSYYHSRLLEVFQLLTQPNQRVLEIGCGRGDLLAGLAPSFGVGVDFSMDMIAQGKKKHPQLSLVLADGHQLPIAGACFDVIIFSDLLNDVWDVFTLFENIRPLCHAGTKIILNSYSRVWELPLFITEKLGLAQPVLDRNWLTVEDVRNFLEASKFEVIRTWQEILFPVKIPLLTPLCNSFLVRFWPFHYFAMTNFLIARPNPHARCDKPGVSIIIPARNEEGNIENIFSSISDLGCEVELVFVEGNSRDQTYSVIQECIQKHPNINAKVFRQKGVGKGDAVRLGFEQSTQEILMILDADLTVPPDYLPRFYRALCEGQGEFINGVRLIYPMEKQAMRFLNLIGNKFFSMLFTWLLGQPIKDTLCGTKVLWKEDYVRIANNRSFFGDFDPFGDFDLLFGAAKLGLKIVDVAVRYRDRSYGTTNISRWKHGLLLFKMAAVAAIRLKFR
jgi:ubiquinone/menaquinone biosynthesis C-methylase UbiE